MDHQVFDCINRVYRKGGSVPRCWISESALAASVSEGFVSVTPLFGYDRVRLTPAGREAIERELGIKREPRYSSCGGVA